MEYTLTFLDYFFLSLEITFPVWGFLVTLIVVLGQIAGRIDRMRPITALYWSFITATTVGYGDVRPTRPLARALSVFIAVCGLVLFGIIVAISTAAATEALKLHVDPALLRGFEQLP